MRMLEGKVSQPLPVRGAGSGARLPCCAHNMAPQSSSTIPVSAVAAKAAMQARRTTADDIIAAGGKAIANLASVADPAGAASIVEDAVKAFGRIDAIVNNAGILRDTIGTR